MRDVWRFERGGVEILAVPVLGDNFVYLLCREGQAVLVDAGAAAPVQKVLAEEGLVLRDIWITHQHHDHIGGWAALQALVEPGAFDLGVVRMDTPGHMAEHTCYYLPQAGVVFTGDMLINGACGRLLGGTAEQLFSSLQQVLALPEETVILGGHDYLVDNMRFAQAVAPENRAVQARLEQYAQQPREALFATVATERASNPFLQVDSVEAFAALRKRKDQF